MTFTPYQAVRISKTLTSSYLFPRTGALLRVVSNLTFLIPYSEIH